MDAKNRENLGRILAYLASTPEQQKAYVATERARLARILREARVRVKTNKAAHGGIYEA